MASYAYDRLPTSDDEKRRPSAVREQPTSDVHELHRRLARDPRFNPEPPSAWKRLALVLFLLHAHRQPSISLVLHGFIAVERRMRHRAQCTRERAVRRAVCKVVLRLTLLLVLVLALGLLLRLSACSSEDRLPPCSGVCTKGARRELG